MNAAALREQFDVLAEAPNGVQRLRDAVLELAVQGRLVPFDAEAVTRPLEAVLAEPSLNGIATKPHDGPSGTPILRISAGTGRRDAVVDEGDHKFLDADAATVAKFQCAPGDLFACRFNGNLHYVGRFALYRGYSGATQVYPDKLIRFRADPAEADPAYLRYALNAPPTRRVIESFCATTAGNIGVSAGRLRRVEVPVPDLAVQRRVVAEVDALLALCDELETRQRRRAEARARANRAVLHHLTEAGDDEELAAGWERLRENFDLLNDAPQTVSELRQAVVQLAVRGRLIPQDPRDQPASVLVERITREKAEAVSKQRAGQPVQPSGAPVESGRYPIPDGWAWVRFGDITINRDGERVPVSSNVRETRRGEYPYYGASGVIDRINDYLFDKTLLLIGEDGANLLLRSTPIAFLAQGKYWVNNHAHVVDGTSEAFLRYLALFINATDLSAYVTGTAQPKLNQARLNSIPVALPPEAEQRRIVATVDELMALCDELDARLARARDRSAALAASVLRRLTAA